MSVLVLTPEDLFKHLHFMDIEKMKEHFKPRYKWHKERFASVTSTVFAAASDAANLSRSEGERKRIDRRDRGVRGGAERGVGVEVGGTDAKASTTIAPALEAHKKPKNISAHFRTFPTLQPDALGVDKPQLASAKHLQYLRDKKVPQSTLFAYSAIMNMKDSLWEGTRHQSALGTDFIKCQMVNKMKPDLLLDKRLFTNTIRARDFTPREERGGEGEREGEREGEGGAPKATAPPDAPPGPLEAGPKPPPQAEVQMQAKEEAYPSTTFVTQPELA